MNRSHRVVTQTIRFPRISILFRFRFCVNVVLLPSESRRDCCSLAVKTGSIMRHSHGSWGREFPVDDPFAEPARTAETLPGLHHQAQLAGRRHSCLAHPRGFTGSLASGPSCLGGESPVSGCAPRSCRSRRADRLRPSRHGTRSAGDSGSSIGLFRRLTRGRFRFDHRSAGTAPFRADDRGHEGQSTRRSGRCARGGAVVLHRPGRSAAARHARR